MKIPLLPVRTYRQVEAPVISSSLLLDNSTRCRWRWLLQLPFDNSGTVLDLISADSGISGFSRRAWQGSHEANQSPRCIQLYLAIIRPVITVTSNSRAHLFRTREVRFTVTRRSWFIPIYLFILHRQFFPDGISITSARYRAIPHQGYLRISVSFPSKWSLGPPVGVKQVSTRTPHRRWFIVLFAPTCLIFTSW